MPFFNVDVPGFNLPQPQQLPSDVRNPMGTLANTLRTISEAQMKRRQDEQMLRTQELQQRQAQMKLDEMQAEAKRDEAMRQALRQPFAPELAANPMGAIPAAPVQAGVAGMVEQQAQRLLKLGRVEEADKLLKTLDALRTNPQSFQERWDLQDRRYDRMGEQKELALQAKIQEGMANRQAVAAGRMSQQEFQERMKYLSADIEQMLINAREESQRRLGAGMQYLPDQAALLDKGAGTASRVPVVPSQAGALPATLPAGKIAGVQPTAPASDVPPGPPPPLSAANQESLAMGDIVQPPDASGTQPLYTGQEYLQPKVKGGSDPQKAVDRLRGEFMKLPPVQDVLKAIGGAKTMLDGFAANNGYDPETGAAPAGGAFDENLLAAWQKGLDPQSAVREGEINRTRSFLAAYPALSAAFDRWTRNEGFGMALDPASRKVLYAALQYGYGAKAKYISGAAKQYGKMAKNRKLPVEDLFVGLPDELIDGVMDEINAPASGTPQMGSERMITLRNKKTGVTEQVTESEARRRGAIK